MRTRSKRFLWGGVTLALLASVWLALAPRHLPGGSAAYVVPSGTSMLPLLHRGDLVITREAEDYGVGDVVAYQSRDLQTVVLHRIIRVDGERFVLKGDNNDFIDSDRPTESELIGRLWLHLPRGGNVLVWLRAPQNAAMLAGGAAFLLLGGVAGAKVRRGRRRRAADPETAQKKRAPAPRSGHQARLILAAIVGAALVGFSALAYLSFTRPLTTTAAIEHGYIQAGTFEYSAAAPRSEVYDRAAVTTGEPVFLRLVPEVSVSFDYRLETDAPHAITGMTRLDAVLGDDTGWARTIELQPPTAFTGDTATVMGILDLGELRGLMLRVQELTRVERSGFTLTLVPRIDVEGIIAAQPVDDSFAPELDLLIDDLLLRVEEPEEANDGSTELFERSQRGSVTGEETVPSTISAPGIALQVEAARRIAVVGLAASLLLGILLGVLMLVRRPRDEPSRISARYGHLLVPVEAGDGLLAKGPVEVGTIEALVQVAERYERSVLHVRRDGENTYLVEGDVVVYRYRPVTAAGEAQESPAPEKHVSGPSPERSVTPASAPRRPRRRRLW